jgi:hypothetical protein
MAISNEERIARLEGGYEHLATKADVENLRGDFKADLSAVRTDFKADLAAAQADTNRRIDRLFWAVIGIGGGLLAAAAAALVRDALA